MKNKYSHVYLVGIGGISVSAIAKLFLKNGTRVSGFDLVKSEITDELLVMGANIAIGDTKEFLPGDVDLLVYSEAVPAQDSLRTQAKKKNIQQMAAAEFWGELGKDKKVIAVSGTNGKSSTTAMIGLILERAGFDPTVVVGTKVLAWNSNIRIGKSDWLVIEADEYAAKMLHYKPMVAIITNIKADHLDFYKDTQDIINHFQKWVNSVPQSGAIVINRDDENSSSLDIREKTKLLFGLNGGASVRAAGISQTSAESGWVGDLYFNIVDDKEDWGFVPMHVPGEHTIANAVAAAVAADFVGVPRKKIRKALIDFTGTWRRFEMLGEYNGALVVSDYAHHPDGIKATLKAARDWYPFNRIIVLFQPHHHNRTKKLFSEFAGSFKKADEVIVSEIYDVSGREESSDQNVSSKDLVEAIKKSSNSVVSYEPNLAKAESALRQKIKPRDVVIIMGAGDVDSVARNLALDTKPELY